MIVKGFLWSFLGRISSQGISFIVSIVLTRLLMPEDFAMIGIVLSILGVASVFVDVGFSQAVIQRKEISPKDLQSVFWLVLGLGTGMSILFYSISGFIADFFEISQLENLSKVLSIVFIINSVSGLNRAIITRSLNFKYLAKASFLSNLIGGITGISFALSGFGVWSLVFHYLISNTLTLILYWFKSGFKPGNNFSINAIKPLWNFSKHLFSASLLNEVFSRLDIFIIGKLFQPATLGYYSRSKTFVSLIKDYSAGPLSSVLFPTLSQSQNDLDRVKYITQTAFRAVLFFSLFLTGLLLIEAKDLFVLLFTDKWLPSVPYFQLLVLSIFINPTSAILIQAASSLGNSKLVFRVDILKKVLILPTYIIGFYFGIKVFLYLFIVSRVIAFVINAYAFGKDIGWKGRDQLIETLTYLSIFIPTTSILFWLSQYMTFPIIVNLIINAVLYIFFILLLAYLFKNEGFIILKNRIILLYEKNNGHRTRS